jgi:hypothetical protein
MRSHYLPGRRTFLKATAAASAAIAVPSVLRADENRLHTFESFVRDLLGDWCEALLALQINSPADPTRHGALSCPSCDFLHGRCPDAVYPFLRMARTTGEDRYITAAVRVFDWSKNTTLPSGAWTVVPDPTTWTGISVFGAISLAEALHHHGDLLDAVIRLRWTNRLRLAADFIHRTFTLDFSNINYGATALHALQLFGKVLDDEKYSVRALELASGIHKYFTHPHHLLYGEGKPAKSPRGLHPVDLGYNVEESLNGIVLYALEVKDTALLETVCKSLASHLAFMLPDGAWDNSWGTRQAKWSYWGSRTADGCQPGFAAAAGLDPAFGAAAWHSTRLLRACTRDGLLHGGPHYATRGVKPCVHHTFAHAKSLAWLLDHPAALAKVDVTTALPRATANGVTDFPEIAVSIAARGPWRATISAYDWLYRPKLYQPTGGSISLLWHQKLGPILAGSMATYVMVEKYNMQPNPDAADHPLTPRIELREAGTWFTQLHDLEAEVSHSDENGIISYQISTRLLSADQTHPAAGPVRAELEYLIDKDSLIIRCRISHPDPAALGATFVLPVVSPTGEKVLQSNEREIQIQKPGGNLIIESDAPLQIPNVPRGRIFNMVPGFEAVPFIAHFAPGRPELHISLRNNP